MSKAGTNNSVLERITKYAKERGFDVRIRDIAFALCKTKFQDSLTSYSAIFGLPQSDGEVAVYEKGEGVQLLLRYFEDDLFKKEDKEPTDAELIASLTKSVDSGKKTDPDDITAEENKAEIIKRIKELKEMYESGEIVAKDYIKLDLEARVKLADKFGVTEDAQKTVLILPPTYDKICPHTHHECFEMTKQYAMQKWHLIEQK